MALIQEILFLLLFYWIDCSIYLTNTEDSLSTGLYDCVYHQNLHYCRRPRIPIPLQRDLDPMNCSNNGTPHSFETLSLNNVSTYIILHQWKSGQDKVEEYEHYLSQPTKSNDSNSYLCECTSQGSFGKNCEYLLPTGSTFTDVARTKFSSRSNTSNYDSDIICYMTLECNSGVLCLDWREVCDGVQNCMFGYDEENCDLLEYNECEDDEYRCMNGMCIPDEYFLDGEFDCMDMSDEKEHSDGLNCPYQLADVQCDDRICPPNEWSCGDGQCIKNRLTISRSSSCVNRRDLFYICETSAKQSLWALPNGRCKETYKYKESNPKNRSINDYCTYLIKCYLSAGGEMNCPCQGKVDNCSELFKNICSSIMPIQYPAGGIITPYVFEYYNVKYNPFRIIRHLKHNGTIKCRGYMTSFLNDNIPSTEDLLTVRELERSICLSTWYTRSYSSGGYHQHCHNSTLIFNNRSYNFIDICQNSKECISAYRINDGIGNCADKNDERQQQLSNEIVFKSCSNQHRHRFRCADTEPTCLYANTLGDLVSHCENKFDESWMGTQLLLSKLDCNSQTKDYCRFLRDYIEASWQTDKNNHSSRNNNSDSDHRIWQQMPFRAYCDTFWDLLTKEDEIILNCQTSWVCPQDQWQCYTGQCIFFDWVLDGEWDCPDASDEENIFAVNFSRTHHNDRWIQSTIFLKNFTNKYQQQPLGNSCNLSIEYPCLRVNTSDLSNVTKSCIDLQLIGNSEVDCIGGYDERNVLPHCNQFAALGYNFKCLSSNKCIPLSLICTGNHRCPNSSDDEIWCRNFQSTEFECTDKRPIKKERCDDKYDCWNGEDEYMCNNKRSFEDIYRKQKQINGTTRSKKLQLPQFPIDRNRTNIGKEVIAIKPRTNFAAGFLFLPLAPDWCNRGIGILLPNKSLVCFCPPQYYGDQCQYHSDRITVFLHLNLHHSNYTKSTDKLTVIKLLVLFLFEDQVLTTDEFHIRPSVEIDTYKKKKTYLLYSQSANFIENKRNRYFNRSNIITEHPYSIRIEAYEMKLNEKSWRFAVWQYSIYFDFLPVFRLAKVLNLAKPNKDEYNPCKGNPCHPNQECYQLQNKRSQYICLCKSNFTGPNCSELHPMCNNNYCSSNALCQADYHPLLSYRKLPYCICPYDYIGKRCHLLPQTCLTNRCQNGGTCRQRSGPDEYTCECFQQYTGTNCEKIRESVYLSISKNNHIAYEGIIVQYFKVNFTTLQLTLVQQNVFSHLPDSVFYLNMDKVAPEIILLKTYSYKHGDIYLILLQLNVTSVNSTTSLSDVNRCIHVKSSIFQYHQLCRNNHSLFCFHDGHYLCICERDHLRAECFIYDKQLDRCEWCLAHGRCLKGSKDEYLCICPPCHSGRHCQFNFESFSFTIDQLFFDDLLSSNRITRDITFYFLILTPCILFLLGFINNYFCFITFRRPKCLRNGIGQYLIHISVINQINLTILLIRLIHLTVNIANPYSYPLFDNILCKTSNYLLNSSTRITYCLSSLIAIERTYVVLFLNGRWLRKPHIARYLILLTTISTLIVSAYELAFIQSQISSDDGHNAICVLNFPSNYPVWKTLHQIVTIIYALIPFLINLFCTIVIIYIVTTKKMNANTRSIYIPLAIIAAINNKEEINATTKDNNEEMTPKLNFNLTETQSSPLATQNRCRLLIDIILENKELVVAPMFTLIPQIFSLPFFVVSFSLRCQNFQGHHLRYLLIVSYMMTFIPQLTSFFLYITPSSFYSKEWTATNIGKRINQFKHNPQSMVPTTKISNEDKTIK